MAYISKKSLQKNWVVFHPPFFDPNQPGIFVVTAQMDQMAPPAA